jgi:hypothetical protein
MASDPQGIISVTVSLYVKPDTLIHQIMMGANADIYFGSGALPPQYTVFDIEYYQFSAMDRLKNVTVSQVFRDRSNFCLPQPTSTPTLGIQ